MPVAATIGAVGSIGSGLLGFLGSSNASNAQVQAQQAALGQQQQFFNVLKGAAQPLINTGTGLINSAGSTLTSLLTPGANMTDTLSQIPGFKFAQDWGQKTVQNLGTTMGLGGNTLTAGANYATGVAQQGYGNIVNSLLGLLQGGGNIASSALSTLGYGAGQFSGQASNTLGNIGNAQASGILGGTNALSGALTGGTGNYTNLAVLSKLLGSGSAPGTPGGIYGGGAPAALPQLPVNPLSYNPFGGQ